MKLTKITSKVGVYYKGTAVKVPGVPSSMDPSIRARMHAFYTK